MACVVGYIRHYYRWNGDPGFTLEEQRKWIRDVAREHGYGREAGRLFLEEGLDGEATRWPKLHKAIRMAEDNVDREILVVIPTLDGVHFNRSFLRTLSEGCGSPIYVRSGWRRAIIIEAKDTNYESRSKSPGWLLTLEDEAASFAEMVSRVRQRATNLPSSIRGGLKKARERGVRLGCRRPGSHRFTKTEQSIGGQTTGRKRRQAATEPYKLWVHKIWSWRKSGESIRGIVMRLNQEGALSEEGRKIGPTQVYRILKRASIS